MSNNFTPLMFSRNIISALSTIGLGAIFIKSIEFFSFKKEVFGTGQLKSTLRKEQPKSFSA